jgi:hypothetical protein
MLKDSDPYFFSIEDARGITVEVGDKIIRGVTVGQTAITRLGKIIKFTRTPKDYGKISYSMQVQWLVGVEWMMPKKPTTVFVFPDKTNNFFKVDLDDD